jgi:hypothetical protein
MSLKPSDERRQHPRYPVRAEVRVRITSSLLSSTQADQSFDGRIYDIGVGGLGILIPEAVSLSGPIRCEIQLADLPVSIPTLTRVRWIGSSPSRVGARIGLHFLL